MDARNSTFSKPDLSGLADERLHQNRVRPLIPCLFTAIRYALSRWDRLTRFIDDGRIEIDSNVVERAIRPIALNLYRLSQIQS